MTAADHSTTSSSPTGRPCAAVEVLRAEGESMTDRKRLERLVQRGERFRRTPIVDDDFPAMRDDFDSELSLAEGHLKKPRPTIVCLCGSTRFKAAWYEQTKRLTHDGMIVLGVGDLNPNHPDTNVPIDPELKARLDELHLRKIDLADEVFVLNVGGYVGDSTRREVAHAVATGKPVRWLEPDKLPSEGRP